MSRESILQIQETERRAEQILAEARARADAMRADAHREGEVLCRTVEEDTRAALADTLQKLRERADAMTERMAEESREAAEELRKNAALRQKSAEKLVTRGLMSKCR